MKSNLRNCITNHVFPPDFDKIGSDNALKGRLPSQYNITGAIIIKCTGNAYFEGVSVVTLGFRYESCKNFGVTILHVQWSDELSKTEKVTYIELI